MEDPESPTGEGRLPTEVSFHYVKSNFFRVVHADGVWGGVTPSGDIQMAFWNQRQPIPTELVQKVSPDGVVGEEVSRAGKKGFIREVEVSVVMDLEEAKSLRKWLDDKIRSLESRVPDRKPEGSK